MTDPAPAPTANPARRKRLLIGLTTILIAAAGAWTAYWALHGRFHETTDDAYVAGHVVMVTSQVAGTVTAVSAVDTDFVEAGAPLVQLDETDSRLALANAEADLARAVRDVSALFANQGALRAATRLRDTEVAKAREDLRRRRVLAGTGALPEEEIAHAAADLASAEALLAQAHENLAANIAQTLGTDIATHPAVVTAAARLMDAVVNHHRTAIVAPVGGLVAKRTVQPGQRVSPGGTLMAVVPLDAAWVDANFKEVQLKRMRIGQPARLTADVYGSGQIYHGRVVGLGAGTGSAFAILPAQNATGNWIKLVQRVPVRIALDATELADHPLRIGLSMSVDVDTHDEHTPPNDQAAPAVAPAPRISPGNSAALRAAEQRVREIIKANRTPPAVP